MALILLSGPAVEPITLGEAKAHLRIDGSAEDALIQSLVITSRLHIEAALSLALVTQSWRHLRDCWPRGRTLNLPLRPVQTIAAVRVHAEDATAETLAPDTTLLDGHGSPARLVWRGSVPPPRPGQVANGLEIDFVAGFGDTAADVPAPIRHALLLLVAHWYEHREPVEIGSASTAIPHQVSDLLMPYRGRAL